MAKQLDNTKIKKGNLIKVENQFRKASAKDAYYALKVEDSDGKNERWLLFTQLELECRSQLEIETISEKFVPGRLYKLGKPSLEFYESYLVKYNVFSKDGTQTTHIINLPQRIYDIALQRARMNQEDIPEQSFISDLLD